MNRPWMPFHVGDYLGDTGHLSTTQHGAYLLLILHYWRRGSLPQEDAKLARIVKLSVKSWVEFIKPDIEPLFKPGWRHKRIDEELAKYETIRTKRAMAGARGGAVTAMSRAIAKAVSLSQRVQNQANAGQVVGKRVATTTTSIPCLESERADPAAPAAPPQVASDEAIAKRPPAFSRQAFDESLEAKRKASA